MPTLAEDKYPNLGRTFYGCDKVNHGVIKWNKEQVYEGEYLENVIHGEGVYRWDNSNIYEGTFFSNSTQGYAVLSFPDNSYFEGLFVKNKAFGPGILTHADGCQDAGFWVGRSLVRLGSAVEPFVPSLAANAAAVYAKISRMGHPVALAQKSYDSKVEILKEIRCSSDYFLVPCSVMVYDPRSIFFEKKSLPATMNSFKERVRVASCWEGENAVVENGFRWAPSGKEKGEKASGPCFSFERPPSDVNDSESCEFRKKVSWNRGELCVEFLKQTYRHRSLEDKVYFKVGKLLLGMRKAFRKPGETEKRCLEFLKTCSTGPTSSVNDFLCRFSVSEELMDAKGNNGLMFASATDHHDAIDILADYGVDANAFNDEGLTPLNLCLLRRLALANGISDWEAAFLPPEPTPIEDPGFGEEEQELCRSVLGLEEVFGPAQSESESDVFGSEESGGKQLKDLYVVDDAKENHLNSDVGQINSYEVPGRRNSKGASGSLTKTKLASELGAVKKSESGFIKSRKQEYFFALGGEPESCESENEARSSTEQHVNGDPYVPQEETDANIADDALIAKQINKIDKTIIKLLSRGADPNISDVPRPSIHLGIFTKDLNVIRVLLTYGAGPNSRLHCNEGLLTPLHVLALLKPSREYVDMCELLLQSGANPEDETAPGFRIFNEEKGLAEPSRGRTPLQLLCMRADAELVDSQGWLSKMALLLAKVCDKKKFYDGHSYLTLAMMAGNIGLLRTLLNSGFFCANQVLGKNLGTALHVLVSTPFQVKFPFGSSIKMCDLLLESRANPLMEFKSPSVLKGTCIDFGYREIESEQTRRKMNDLGKRETKGFRSENTEGRDFLLDHVKVMEYLSEKARQRAEVAGRGLLESADKPGESLGRKRKASASQKQNTIATHSFDISEAPTSKNPKHENVSLKKLAETKKEDESVLRKSKSQGSQRSGSQSRNRRGSEGPEKENGGFERSAANPDKQKRNRRGSEGPEKENGGFERSAANPDKQKRNRRGSEGPEKENAGFERSAANPDKQKRNRRGSEGPEKENGGFERAAANPDKQKNRRAKEGRHDGESKKNTDTRTTTAGKQLKKIKAGFPKKNKDLEKGGSRKNLNEGDPEKISSGRRSCTSKESDTDPVIRCKATVSQTMLEYLRRVFGYCENLDANQLLLPYVVFRDGNLYYKFHGKSAAREQYSLL